jgi:hypothetical protein
MNEEERPSAMMRYARALGWGALAAAPILLATLALVASRPQAPGSVFAHAMGAAWIAGGLAFGAGVVAERGAPRASRALGSLAGAVAIGFCIFLVWISIATRPVLAALDARERAGLERVVGDPSEPARLRHPLVGFSFSDPGRDLEPAPSIEEEAARAGGPEWRRAHRIWAWEGRQTEVVVDLSRTERADAAALDNAMFEIATPLRRSGNIVRRAEDGWVVVDLRGTGTSLTRVLLVEVNGRAYRIVIGVVTRERDRWLAWLETARAG